MALRLMIVSAHRESMGGAYIQEFKACGGSIGRSLECDWPLPDSKRYLSSKHAMIDYRACCYYLVDLSRNGIYINNSAAPVGSGNPQRLFDGDKIRMGEYEMHVAIIEEEASINDTGLNDSVLRAQLVQEDVSVETPLLSADHLQESVQLVAMLEPGNNDDDLSCISEISSGKNTMLNDAANHGVMEAAEIFLTAAGLDTEEFQDIEPKLLLDNAAKLLTAFVAGTNELLTFRDAISKRLNINNQQDNKADNPLHSAYSIENALQQLLHGTNDGSSHGPEAIKAAFDELLRHQQSVIAAMREESSKSRELETSE
jgi:type VI secretion system protein ImpI